VDHAGEYGAKKIYQGQLAAIKDTQSKIIIQEMADHEDEHLQYFEQEIIRNQVRPSFLLPVWHVAGYALGFITGKIGIKASMACTQAVEEVIEDHYNSQITQLNDNTPLKDKIIEFKAEEINHKDIAAHYSQATDYPLLRQFIKFGCKTAIFFSKRI
jgi:ubiquinone biosynthesis monooxygenase Coq7